VEIWGQLRTRFQLTSLSWKWVVLAGKWVSSSTETEWETHINSTQDRLDSADSAVVVWLCSAHESSSPGDPTEHGVQYILQFKQISLIFDLL
jgi:hypothetical protein